MGPVPFSRERYELESKGGHWFMGEMAVMGREGDLKITWDRKDSKQTADAQEQFDTLVGKGYLAFAVDKSGNKGEQITTFDPAVERIILAPQIRGGL